MWKKFKNWMIKFAIKGLVQNEREICDLIKKIESKLKDKYL